MTERMDELLEHLADPPVSCEPPAAFLHAVARRGRHRRALVAAAWAVPLTLAATLLAIQWPRDRGVTEETPPPQIAASDASVLMLTRLNAGRDIEELLLPDGGSGSQEAALRVGLRWGPEEVGRWVRQ